MTTNKTIMETMIIIMVMVILLNIDLKKLDKVTMLINTKILNTLQVTIKQINME